jgi:hypothetical protein
MKKSIICCIFVTIGLLASFGEGAQVLWDTHHGLCRFFECDPESINSHLLSILEIEGISIVISDSGVLNLDLSNFDGIVISVQSSDTSAYSDFEVDVIEDFVRDGGGLIIMGDQCANTQNINPVAQRFGVFTDPYNSIYPIRLFPLISHPILEGVNKLEAWCASKLIIESPAVPTGTCCCNG